MMTSILGRLRSRPRAITDLSENRIAERGEYIVVYFDIATPTGGGKGQQKQCLDYIDAHLEQN